MFQIKVTKDLENFFTQSFNSLIFGHDLLQVGSFINIFQNNFIAGYNFEDLILVNTTTNKKFLKIIYTLNYSFSLCVFDQCFSKICCISTKNFPLVSGNSQ